MSSRTLTIRNFVFHCSDAFQDASYEANALTDDTVCAYMGGGEL